MIDQSKAIIFFHCPYGSHYILSDQCKFRGPHWWACNMYQCWAVLRMRDRYPLVINPGIYSLAPWFSRFSNKWSWHITVILKFFKKSENQSKNHAAVRWGVWNNWNWRFFDSGFFSQTTRTDSSVKVPRTVQHWYAQVELSEKFQLATFQTSKWGCLELCVAKIRQLVSKKTSQFWSKSTSKVWVFSIVSIVEREIDTV
jgi:hypothetical protein